MATKATLQAGDMSDKELIERVAQAGALIEPNVHLTRADWLEAAIRLFMQEGVEAVRITRLAQVMAVTRGSFYWHFKDRDDLLDGLVSFWEQKNMRSTMLALENVDNLQDGMLSLFSTWLDVSRFEPGLDMAMRDWARRSERVRQAVARADKACMNALANFFQRMGVEEIEAQTRARTTYFCQIGYYLIGLQEELEDRMVYLDDTMKILGGQPLDPAKAKAFAERMYSVQKDNAKKVG